MKNGFTLMELLVVIVLTAIISAGSAMIFSKSNSDTNEEDLRGKYREMQRAANYVDLNDSWRNSLNEDRKISIKLGELQASNYVDKNFKNSVTNQAFPSSYIIKLYIASAGDNEYLDSCVVRYSNGQEVCIANSRGYACECCDTPISEFNKKCSN